MGKNTRAAGQHGDDQTDPTSALGDFGSAGPASLPQAPAAPNPHVPRRGNQALGRFGESLAVRYLEARGYQILDRNWRCRHGEIDIVARSGKQLAFVEVKTRSSNRYGHPFEAITPSKLSRMYVLARLWCVAHPSEGSRPRLDVIGILVARGSTPLVEHLAGVHA